MSYSRGSMNAIGVDATPSLMYNNLSTNGDKVVYLHKERATLFNEAAVDGKVDSESETVAIKGASTVTQAKWIRSGRTALLVVCSSQGIQVFDSTSKRLLFFDPLAERLGSDADKASYARGVTVNQSTGELLVGYSAGHIAVYTVAGEAIKAKATLLKEHTSPITCLESSADNWASADNNGSITVWSGENAPVAVFKGSGFPCTSIALRGDVVVAAYATGQVCMYRISKQALAVEVSAHARCINALAVHPSRPLVATVGEDTVLNVFSLPDFESAATSTVEVVFTTTVTDRLLTGVQFTQSGAKSHIMVSAYDSHSISTWISS